MKNLLFCLSVLVSAPLFANFLPPNRAPTQLLERESNGMTQAEFNSIIDQVEKIYDPLIYRQGGNLQINRLWANNDINATSAQNRGQRIINLYGGLARHPLITADAFALVVCHEVGHHLAGFPQMSSWAATEGNADYFANQSCVKKLWSQAQLSERNLPAEENDLPQRFCESAYGSDDPSHLPFCQRQLAAAYSLASLLALLDKQTIQWDTPDLTRVPVTILQYPSPQCRLDTLTAASLCRRAFSDKIIPGNEKEMAAASCHGVNGDTIGLRPACWFSPRL